MQGAGGDGVELGVGEPEGVDTIRTAQVDVRSMLKVSRNATPVPAFTVAPVAISMLSPFSRAPVAPVTFAPALNCTAKSAAPTDPATRSAEVAALISAAAAVSTTVMAPFAVVTKIEPVAEIPFTPPTLVRVMSSTSWKAKKVPGTVTFAARLVTSLLPFSPTSPTLFKLRLV